MYRLHDSRLTSLFKTVSTADRVFPTISCRTNNILTVLGTHPASSFLSPVLLTIVRRLKAVRKVVLPHPFRPINPYRRPRAKIKFAPVNKFGPPPRKLGNSKFNNRISLVMTPSPSSSSSPCCCCCLVAFFVVLFSSSSSVWNIVIASAIARCRSSSSNWSRMACCRCFRRFRSDMAIALLEGSIIFA